MVEVSLVIVSLLLAVTLFLLVMVWGKLIQSNTNLQVMTDYCNELSLTASTMQSYMLERHKIFVPAHKGMLEQQIQVDREMDKKLKSERPQSER